MLSSPKMSYYPHKSERLNFVYMMSNYHRNVLYTGSTSDLISRVEDHKAQRIPGFTKKYNAVYLVWYEIAEDMDSALLREHRIKRWRRAWKNTLVEELNPQWEDLFERAKIELALLADY